MVYSLLKDYDGVMLGRLIQHNPFLLKQVDKNIYLDDKVIDVNEGLIEDYFEYIKTKTGLDSMFRLLSPLLQIFLVFQTVKCINLRYMNIYKRVI